VSIAAMAYCWEHAPVKGSQLLVLLAIADSARDPDWVAWPSIRTLCAKTRMGERGVRYILRDLEDARCIATEIEGSRAGTNLYRVLRSMGQTLPPDGDGGHDDAAEGGMGEPFGGHEDAPNPLSESLMNGEGSAAANARMETRFQDHIDALGPERAAWLARHGVVDYRSWLAALHVPLGDTPERTWARATRALKR
jgi:hypothetical protein